MHLFSLICAASCLAMEIRKVDLNLKRDHNAPSTLNFQHALQKLEVVKDKLFPTKNGFLQNQQHFNKEDISKDAIDDIFAAVRNISKNSIADLVSGIETQMQTYADAMQTCTDTEGYVDANPKKGEYDGLVTETSTADAQVTAFETANDTECADVEAKCTKRDTEGLALYNAMVGSTGCSYSTPPDSSIVYDDGFVFSGADQFATTIEGLHTAWDTAKTECETETNKCNTASNNLNEANTNATTSCAAQEAKKVAGQSAYDTCWNTAEGSFTGYTYADTLTPVQTQIQALENLICMISPAIDTLLDGSDTTNALPSSVVACELVDTQPTDAEAVFIQTGRKTHHTRKTQGRTQAKAGGATSFSLERLERLAPKYNMSKTKVLAMEKRMSASRTRSQSRPASSPIPPQVGMIWFEYEELNYYKGDYLIQEVNDDPYEPIPNCNACNMWDMYFNGDLEFNGLPCIKVNLFNIDNEDMCFDTAFQWMREQEACCQWDKTSPPEVYTTTSTTSTDPAGPTTVANEGYYVCTCTVDGEEHYKNYYDFTVQEVQAPTKDNAWDSLGCEGAQDTSGDGAGGENGGYRYFGDGMAPCDNGRGSTPIVIEGGQTYEQCETLCDDAVGCTGFRFMETAGGLCMGFKVLDGGEWCDAVPCEIAMPGAKFYAKCAGAGFTTPAPQCTVPSLQSGGFNGVSSLVSDMQDDGWTINVNNNPGNAPYAVTDYCDPTAFGYFYGWDTDAAVGEISYTFSGTGTAYIEYGNCWHHGWVSLYIDGSPIPDRDAQPGDTMYYEFSFTNGMVLMLKDNGENSVMIIKEFRITCS